MPIEENQRTQEKAEVTTESELRDIFGMYIDNYYISQLVRRLLHVNSKVWFSHHAKCLFEARHIINILLTSFSQSIL